MLANMLENGRRQVARLDDTVIGRLWTRLLELEFIDRAIALAAKAFVSFFPLLIVVSALSPPRVREVYLEVISGRFGVSGEAFTIVRQAFNSADETRQATGVVGVIVVLLFAVSFTTTLQRTYLRAWRRPSGGGARNKGRGAVWLAGITVMLMGLGGMQRLLVGPAGDVAVAVIGVLGSVLLWWWTARMMLRREVTWRALLPTAIMTGAGGWLYTLAASVWMPAAVSNNYAQFGAFGIALSFVTWFTGLAFIVIVAAALGPALTDGQDPVGRWLRQGSATALEPGAAEPLPGPVRPMRLADALGRGGGGSGVTAGPGAGAASD